MREGRFSALLSVIVPPVVELIAERKGVPETAATESFYRSTVMRDCLTKRASSGITVPRRSTPCMTTRFPGVR